MKTSFPKDKIRIALLEGIHPRAEELLRAEGFGVESHAKAFDSAALRELLAGGVHALGLRSKTLADAAAIEAGVQGRLLAIGAFCIGTDQVDLRAARLRGVPVFNSPFSNTRSVAELTLAEIIALHRGLTVKNDLMHRGVWDKSAAGAHEIRGRTLGIVGYGRIGSQLSVLAEAMGMRVVYHDTARVLPLGNAKPVRTLGELLAASDVVSVHVPATPATEGPPPLIDGTAIAAMRPGVLFLNNARGRVVDVPALAAALRTGHIGGAALDVFPEEPAGRGEPFVSDLRGLPNVILTPHIGGSTEEAQEAIAADVAGKLITFINNGSTSGAVNVPEVDLPEQAAPDASGAAPRRHRILHFHRNVPGVLSRINGAVADTGGNIAAEYLRTNEDIGYVVLDVDPRLGAGAAEIADRLREVPETIRVRALY